MFCSRCGSEIPAASTVCPKCAAPVASTQPWSAPAVSLSPAPPPPVMPQAGAYAGAQQTDGKAVTSLILGILSWLGFWLLTGIPAIIFGHMSRKAIRESQGRLQGDGMALTGLILGYISVAIIPFILIIAAIAIPSLL